MRLHLPRSRVLRALIYYVCVSLVLMAADLIWVQMRCEIRPGFETTRIVSPALPDGSVDYLMAHDNSFGQGVTPENNAVVPLLSAFGRAGLPSNQPTDGITDRLGMPHLPEKGDYFVTYENYCHDHSADEEADPFNPGVQLHWPMTFQAVTTDWVKANEKPLALVAEASKRTRYFFPWYGGTRPELLIEILLPQANLVRESARAMLTRAVIRLQAGDAAGFGEDVLAVHRLARLADQAGTLIEQLVALGPMESAACRIDRMAITSGKLSPEQMRSLAGQLAAMEEMPSYLSAIDEGERYMTLDIMQAIARSPMEVRDRIADQLATGFQARPDTVPEWVMRFWPIPCEESMRELNHTYDGMITASRQPTYPRRIAALNLMSESMAKIHQRNWLTMVFSADQALATLMLSNIAFENHYQEARMERRITLIALALADYKAAHGAYPADLSGLPCDCDDLFVERPLIYTLKDKGYVLYSVGPNMTDNGGKSDDIAFNSAD